MINVVYEKEKCCSAAYDGEKQIGVCQYDVSGGNWTIFHPATDPAYGGQGIAKRLVLCVDEAAKKEGAQIISTCSYAKKVLGH